MSDTAVVYNIIGRDRASAAFHKVGQAAKVAMAIGAVAVLKFGSDSVKAFAESEKSQQKLSDAFARFPNLADTNIDRLNELNSTLAKKTRFDDDATASAQATLAQFKLTGTQIEELTPLLQDYAAKTGKSLPDAASSLGKALMGQGRSLKSLGINFTDAGSVGKNFEQIMGGLRDKVGGFAEKEGKSAAGQAAILQNQFGELQEKVGGMLVPALLQLTGPLGKVVDWLGKSAGWLVPVVAGIAAIAIGIKVWTAAQWLLNFAMSANPIGLIIIAIGAVIAIIAVLWTRSSAFRNFFIGLWNHIWGFLKKIGAWFAGPFAGFFVRAWNSLISGATRAATTVRNRFNSFMDFFKSLPGKIAGIASRMWGNLVSGFRGAINFLISGWNSLDFGIHIHLPAILGGAGVDIADVIPDIPYLAHGGVVKARPGGRLIVAGEGGDDEAVVPLPRGGMLGGGGTMRVIFDIRGGDAEMRRWLRRIIRIDGGTEVTFADGGLT